MSENQASPAETLSGQDVEVEPATRHPATYCMPVPSGRVWGVWDPCVVCKGKHPLWRCVVFKAKTPTQRSKIVRNNGMCSRCISGKHSTRLCRKEITCSHPGCSHPGSHNVLLHGAERVCGACGDSQHDRKDCPLKAKKCDSCGRKEKCPDETTAECPAIDAECRTCGGKGRDISLGVALRTFSCQFLCNLFRTLTHGTQGCSCSTPLTAWRMKRKWTTRCPRFKCKNGEGVCLCRIVRSFLRGSKLLSPWHLETCPTKATKNCEGVCLCRIVRSFLRGSKLLS